MDIVDSVTVNNDTVNNDTVNNDTVTSNSGEADFEISVPEKENSIVYPPVNEKRQKQKRKPSDPNAPKRKRKVTFTPEPLRGESIVYDLSTNKPAKLDFRDDEQKVSNKFQTQDDLRQVSRNRHLNGIIRSMYKLKLVCDDDTFLSYTSKEKEKSERFKTNDMLLEGGPGGVTPAVPETPPPPPPPVVPQEPLPTVFELARASPSKPMAKPTARTLARDRVCAVCEIVYESKIDEELCGDWIGCEGLTKAKECNYWVHACCLGFVKSKDDDSIEDKLKDITFYCPQHNNVTKKIDEAKEKREMAKKRRKGGRVR